MLSVEVGVERNIMVALQRSVSASRGLGLLTSNNDLGLEVCLLYPFDCLLQFRESPLIRHITSMDEYITLWELERAIGSCVVGIGNTDEARLAHD